MAYKNNLLEYYGGGSVPYRQGYKKGGEIPRFESKKAFADYYKSEMNKLKGDYKGMSSDEYGIALYGGADSSRVRLLDRVKEQFWKDNYERLLGETGYPESIHENKEPRLENIYRSKPFGAENYKQKAKDSFLRDTYGEGLSDSLNIYSEFQDGGSVGNSLLSLQYGGPAYAGGSRGLGNLGRLRSIMKASKDVQDRAEQIKSKKKKGGFWGKALGKVGKWGGKKLLGGALSTFLGPGLGFLAAETIGSGIGGFLGAKFGYGKKVGTGLDKTKWLAGERKKLGSAEGDLGDFYMDIAGKQASATAKAGGKKFLKDVGAKTWGEYGQAKLGIGKYSGEKLTPFNEGAEEAAAKARAATPTVDPFYKPAEGEDIFGFGEMNRSKMAEGMTDYAQSPMVGGLNIPSMGDPTAGADPFQYARSGFGAQEGQQGGLLGGMSSLVEGGSNVLQQQPWAQAGYELPTNMPQEPPSFGEDLIMGQGNPWSNITSGAYAGPTYNEGGMVRDDRALIDMLYRR